MNSHETALAWSLVTEPDEQQRCCVVVGDRRCAHAASFRIAGADGALDDYTHVCRDHLELVRRPGDVVVPVER